MNRQYGTMRGEPEECAQQVLTTFNKYIYKFHNELYYLEIGECDEICSGQSSAFFSLFTETIEMYK